MSEEKQLKRYRLRDKAGPHTVHSDKGQIVVRTMKAGDTIDVEEGPDDRPYNERYLEKFDYVGLVSELDPEKKKSKKAAPAPEPAKKKPEDEEDTDEEEEEGDEGEEDENDGEHEEHEGEEDKEVTDKFVRAKKKGVKVFFKKDKTYYVTEDDDEDNTPIHKFEKKNDLKEWLSKEKKKKKKK